MAGNNKRSELLKDCLASEHQPLLVGVVQFNNRSNWYRTTIIHFQLKVLYVNMSVLIGIFKLAFQIN